MAQHPPKKKLAPAWVPLTIFGVTIILLIAVALSNHDYFYQEEPALEVVEEPAPDPVVIDVDGVGCVIAELPTLTYYVTTDSVRVTIECDSDILFHYLPALPVPDPEGEANDNIDTR